MYKSLKDIPLDVIEVTIKESDSFIDVFKRLGYPNGYRSGGQLRWLRKIIEDNNFDCSHMSHKKKVKSYRKIPLDEVFCKDSLYPQSNRRSRVIRENLIPYVCAICGQGPEWNGKPLPLTLDHINGDHNDNRLENLRFICPNCDRQQKTFGSRNTKRYFDPVVAKTSIDSMKHVKCPICGGPMARGSEMCFTCRENKKWQNSKCPSKEILIKDLLTFKNFVRIGKKYGTSDNSVRKWCRHYGLPTASKILRYDTWLKDLKD